VTGRELCALHEKIPLPHEIAILSEKLFALDQKHAQAENIDTFKTVVLQGVIAEGALQIQMENTLSPETAESLPLMRNLFSLILAGAAAASVYILPRGCIEHYYTQSEVRYMPVTAKDRLFHAERENLLTADEESVREDYRELIEILESACTR
jgi:hypothetical protein